jgi:hypothetical protein
VGLAATEDSPSAGNANLVSAPALVDRPFHPVEAHSAAVQAARQAERKASPEPAAVAVSPQLEAIAACESGGDPAAVSSTGDYRGKYQFSPATWQAVGGTGDPAAAPEAEQDRRAAILYAQSGPAQWPNCAQ